MEHTVNLLPSSVASSRRDDRPELRHTGDTYPPPATAEEFARHVIFVICQASVTPSVGRRAYEQCMRTLEMGLPVRMGFRHPGKAEAIGRIWQERERFFRCYVESNDKLAYLAGLPWIGPVTKRILARRLGLFADQQAIA